jgi:hypothetical protein
MDPNNTSVIDINTGPISNVQKTYKGLKKDQQYPNKMTITMDMKRTYKIDVKNMQV